MVKRPPSPLTKIMEKCKELDLSFKVQFVDNKYWYAELVYREMGTVYKDAVNTNFYACLAVLSK